MTQRIPAQLIIQTKTSGAWAWMKRKALGRQTQSSAARGGQRGRRGISDTDDSLQMSLNAANLARNLAIYSKNVRNRKFDD